MSTEIEKRKNFLIKSKNSVYLKRVNSDSSNDGEMTKDILFELLANYNHIWDDKTKTLIYPIMPDPPYCDLLDCLLFRIQLKTTELLI